MIVKVSRGKDENSFVLDPAGNIEGSVSMLKSGMAQIRLTGEGEGHTMTVYAKDLPTDAKASASAPKDKQSSKEG